MKPKILFRTDGSPQIGLGHMIRCSALAHMLKEDFDITFYCKDVPDAMLAEFDESGFSCSKIENEEEFLDQLTGNTIAVLDGYHFDITYQRQIKSRGAKLVCIDDLHDKEFIADLIINHAPGVKPEDYKVQPYTQFALGPEYALLRPAFLEQAKKERKIEKIETMMICFGGSDYKNLTASTLKIVAGLDKFKKIKVVTGSAYNYTDSLNLLVNKDKRIIHYNSVNEKQMLSIMLESDLAIVPASGILFEVLAAGCFAITGSYIDNQNYILKGFSNLNAVAETANLSDPRSALLRFINGTLPRRKSSIDGESKNRILCKIKALYK